MVFGSGVGVGRGKGKLGKGLLEDNRVSGVGMIKIVGHRNGIMYKIVLRRKTAK